MLNRKHIPPQDLAEIDATLRRFAAAAPTAADVGRSLQQAGDTMRRMATDPTTPPDPQDRPARRDQAQDLDPHLAERLHQLRQRLGLSVNDMAQRVGLWGANGADNLRQMERCARAIPGTLQVLLPYIEREQLLESPAEAKVRTALRDSAGQDRKPDA